MYSYPLYGARECLRGGRGHLPKKYEIFSPRSGLKPRRGLVDWVVGLSVAGPSAKVTGPIALKFYYALPYGCGLMHVFFSVARA